jgi:hypothetical protein
MCKSYHEQSVLVAQILYEYANEKKNDEIGDYYKYLHKLFYKLKKLKPEYFDRLFYDNNGHFPYCKDLDYMLHDFNIRGVIIKTNSQFSSIKINREIASAMIFAKENERLLMPHRTVKHILNGSEIWMQ